MYVQILFMYKIIDIVSLTQPRAIKNNNKPKIEKNKSKNTGLGKAI